MATRDVLDRFERREDDFHLSEITTALGQALKSGEIPAAEKETAYAEMDAFSFRPGATEWETGWGLYYGPSTTIPQADGSTVVIPNLAVITADTIEYWKRRTGECRHPMLRNRYADLVWELSMKVTGSRASPEYARAAIDAAIELSKRDATSQVRVFETLERALRLARSLNDADRVTQVRDALIAYEERRGEDGKPGAWGRAFALLLGEKLAPTDQDIEDRLVRELEGRLSRVSDRANPVFDPHATERTALTLATYYRSRKRPDDVRRVLTTSADAYRQIAEEAGGLPASAWLESAARNFESFGLREEAASLQPHMRDAHRRARSELVETPHRIEVPSEDMAAFVEHIARGTVDEALGRIATGFIIDRDVAEEQVVEIARATPIQAMIPRVIVDDEGRPEARIYSIQDDLEGHVVHHMANSVTWQQLWLRASFQGLADRFQLSVDDLCAFVFVSPAFGSTQHALVRQGLEYYLAGDVVGTAHVLVPQIEQALRRIVMLAGGSHLKTARGGGFRYRLLDDLLRDPVTETVLGTRIVRYLQVLLTDQRGLNLRNDIAHGLLPDDRFTPVVADRLVHVLLVLGLVRAQPSAGATDSGEQTSTDG